MAAISKKASKRARRRQIQQADRKALYDHKKLRAVAKHLSLPADSLPALPRLRADQLPYYTAALPELEKGETCTQKSRKRRKRQNLPAQTK